MIIKRELCSVIISKDPRVQRASFWKRASSPSSCAIRLQRRRKRPIPFDIVSTTTRSQPMNLPRDSPAFAAPAAAAVDSADAKRAECIPRHGSHVHRLLQHHPTTHVFFQHVQQTTTITGPCRANQRAALSTQRRAIQQGPHLRYQHPCEIQFQKLNASQSIVVCFSVSGASCCRFCC